MSLTFFLFAYFSLKLSLCHKAEYKDFTNEVVERHVDISQNIVLEKTKISVKNTGNLKDSYPFYIIPKYKENLSYFKAFGPKNQILNFTKHFDTPNTFYKILYHFDENTETKIEVEFAFTHVLRPDPPTITIDKSPSVAFEYSSHFYSPIFTKAQTSVFETSQSKSRSTKFLSVEAIEPFEKKKNKLVLGPYTDVDGLQIGAAFSNMDLHVRFVTSGLFKTALSLTKTVAISHWGAVNIKEKYVVFNSGSKLVGSYNDMIKKNAIHTFEAFLPKSAKEVYVRDVVGHIYSFHTAHTQKGQILKVEPRFPIHGGWKTTFEVGYSVPLTEMVSKEENLNRLSLSSKPLFGDFVIDKYTLNVVLPEGAKNWTIDRLYNQEFDYNVVTKRMRSFLDTVGSPIIQISQKNVVSHNFIKLNLDYKYEKHNLLYKPLLLSLYVFITVSFFVLFFSISVFKENETSARKIISDESESETVVDINAIKSKIMSLKTESPNLSRKEILNKTKSISDSIDKFNDNRRVPKKWFDLTKLSNKSTKKIMMNVINKL